MGVPMTLSELALSLAVADLGVHEQGGPNQGPEVNLYLASVGLNPGNPWCAAAVFNWFMRAAAKLGLTNPVPKTGNSLRLARLAEPYCFSPSPSVGAVYVLKHSETTGHVGIVETLTSDGQVATEISGNTNAQGSREGDRVARHNGTPEVSHGGELLGYWQFDKAAQSPDAA